jgi:hypothetical protein
MGPRNRRAAGRFQIEALEARWTPGGMSGGVLGDALTRPTGKEAPPAQVVPMVKGGAGGGVIGLAPRGALACGIGEEIPQAR